MNKKYSLMCRLSLCLVLLSGSTASAQTPADVDHEAITIWSEGVRLAGDIYKPKNLEADQQLPGILLVTGWGGSKENLKLNYAPQFAQRGFIVLAFDYKSWGRSDGPLVPIDSLAQTEEAAELKLNATHIRNVVNPYSMLADIQASLNYLSGEPRVMPPFPGPEGLQNPGLKGYPDWAALKRFDPMLQIAGLQVPTLIIDAENEVLFDRTKNGLLLHETIKDRVDSRYIVYPGQHYDMYRGDNLEAAATVASDWFVKHLKSGG